MAQEFPILDDHFHLNRRTGKGPEVIKEFMRSGGTHIVLVTLPSWSCGVTASKPEDFREVFDSTLADAEAVADADANEDIQDAMIAATALEIVEAATEESEE